MIRADRVDFSNFEEKIKELEPALAAFGADLIAAYLFGSSHTGRTTPLSDIDIALLLADELIDPHVETKTLLRAAEIFGTGEIDLLNLNQAPLRFQYNAIKDKRVLFCSDEKKRIDFETRTIMDYLDFAPMRHAFNQEFLKTLGLGGLGNGREDS